MKKITLFSIVILLGFALTTSCEKEDINAEITSEINEQNHPTPLSFQFEDIKLASEKVSEDPIPVDISINIWVKPDNSYYEKKGTEIIENTNSSNVVNTYKIQTAYNDPNYYITQNIVTREWIALSKIESINTVWTWNSTTNSWDITNDKVNLIIQSPNDFELELTSLTDNYARYEWDREIFSEYKYDIFLDGEKLEENMKDSRALYLFRRLPNSDTEYSAKIVAKGPGQDVKIKYLSFKTAKTITISPFEVEIRNITGNSVVLDWEEPTISEDLEVFYRVSITQWITETFTQEDWDAGRHYWDTNTQQLLPRDPETFELVYDDPSIIGREFGYLEHIDYISDITATEFSTDKLMPNTEYSTLVEAKVTGTNNYEERKAMHGEFTTSN